MAAALGDDPVRVAPRLLGAVLRYEAPDGAVAIRLTEVEAYAGERDPGSHAFRGPTPRTSVMFGPAGFLYVYRSYGIHACVNVVCGADGEAAAVLLRGGEVVEGETLARRRRGTGRAPLEPSKLARGPGNLGRAIGLEPDDSGRSAVEAPLSLALPAEPAPPDAVLVTPRVGVAAPGGGPAFPWRFALRHDPTVSAYRAHASVRTACG